MAQSMPRFVETAGRYVFYVALLVSLNSATSLFAANPDSDYRDALSLFQRRDIASCQRTISLLEKNLEQKADHIDSQALLSFAYAHEAFIMSQLGESGSDYQNSADAFAKAVLAQQPNNAFARKTSLLLKLIVGNYLDVRKTLDPEMNDKQTDADLWYFYAVVSEGDKVGRALSTALTLNGDLVWIYNDMAFRALKMGDSATAEKWVRALDARRPGLADSDLLKAAIAAQKQDKKTAQNLWNEFTRKAPGFPLVTKLSGRSRKK